jgi:hypothetical protein
MDSFPWIRIGSFEKHTNAHYLEVVHANRCGCGSRFGQVIAPNKDIDVFCCAHCRRILGGYPQSNGLAADKRESHARFFQRNRDSLQAVGYFVERH